MSGNPPPPPSYDEVLKASAPPAGPDQGTVSPPYPTSQHPSYPTPQQPSYTAPQQPSYTSPQQPSYPPQPYPGQPSYATGVPPGVYPVANHPNYPPYQQYQAVQPGYGPQSSMPPYSGQVQVLPQGEYTHNTVTVVNATPGTTYPAGYGQVGRVTMGTPQLLAQQNARKRICIGIFIFIFCFVFFIIIINMIINV